ncbi:MATE family efflux transporter [Texcoconibacillus texcoconensis]|uniref:Probable multidrug resistance protein NorM n=1 Tax=Texcoconibacillus texcoconensis TaxID=1095777 RepID=A0A840QTJ3_9BACI|nr:MATE family efflux transporter [Texcoconibacillus texcoconensis]MBB5174685.1 MATE family multidrug resistance protein [Texcoconibacillus texcoconensis]
MYETKTWREKIRLLMFVMWPILITQVGLTAMNFIDTTMSGQAGADDLAGVAIGSSLWMPVFTGVTGVLLAMTPIISQKIGAKRAEEVPFSVIQGVYLSIAIAAIVIILGYFVLDPILQAMSLEDSVRHVAKHYLIGLALGIVPLFVYTVLRCFIDSLGQTRVTMVITLMALPVNFVFNYALIFGRFGFPELGGIGAGYASAVTYWVILFITYYYVANVRPFSPYQVFKKLYQVSISTWKEILLLGLPIGMTIFFEASIFSAVTLLMSQFTTEIIAAHQAALNFSSLLYMLPLSIAMALTIAVGFEVGAKRISDAKAYGAIGMVFALMLALFACVVIYVLREPAGQLYTNDPEVLDYIKTFLIFAIFFQFSDALNTPIQGVLRGYKDVNVPFVAALVSFWIFGLPAGYYFANYTFFGPYGYWIGLTVGLTACALFLLRRLFVVQNREERKVEQETLKDS